MKFLVDFEGDVVMEAESRIDAEEKVLAELQKNNLENYGFLVTDVEQLS